MKRYFLVLSIFVLIWISYYFLLKPYEFEVKFTNKALPGDVIETIRLWNKSIDGEILKVDSFSRVDQLVKINGSAYMYDWRFISISDTITQVKVGISEPTSSLKNKLLVPFTKAAIEIDAQQIIGSFYEVLKVHLEITDVKIKGVSTINSSLCVCRTLETDQIDKANGMMKDYSLLTSYIESHNLSADGPPMVRVIDWNHSKGKIKFDFCFPILPVDSLPMANSVFFEKFATVKSIKAEYRGNYITSDRAWYSLLKYAEQNRLNVRPRPIEIFHNNPNLGLNEVDWLAEIHLPLAED
jgi:hypothetical protein